MNLSFSVIFGVNSIVNFFFLSHIFFMSFCLAMGSGIVLSVLFVELFLFNHMSNCLLSIYLYPMLLWKVLMEAEYRVASSR